MSESTKRNATNVVASLLGYAVPLFVNFASTPYLMKSLGEDAFGIQVLVNVVIGYLAMMDLGIGLPLIKYLAEDKAKGDMKSASELLSTTLVLYIGLGALGMLVAFAFSRYLAESFFSISAHLTAEAAQVFQLAAVGFLGTLLMGWARSVAMGLQRYDIVYAISSLSSVLGVGIGLFLIYGGFGVVGYVLSKVVFLFIAAFVYFIVFRVFIPEYKISFCFSKVALIRIKSYLVYGVMHRAVSGLAGTIDQTLIGVWLGAASVGLYSLPYMLTNAISYALSFMLNFIMPASSALYEMGEHERLKMLFLDSSRFLVAVSCMCIVPLILLGYAFLCLWLDIETATKILTTYYFLSIAVFLNVIFASIASNVLVGTGRIKQFTVYTLIRVSVFSLFCILFIPIMGYQGAALGCFLTSVLDIIYLIYFMKVYFNGGFLRLFYYSFFRPFVCSGCILLVFFFLLDYQLSWLEFILFVFLIELVFCISYYKCNVIRDEEKIEVMKFIAKVIKSIQMKVCREKK